MKARYYFSDLCDERCYTLKSIRQQMIDQNVDQVTIYPAKMCIGLDSFYCTYFGDLGTVGEGCGKDCEAYDPRNGKNGRCRYSHNCYEPNHEHPIILTQEQCP